MRSTSFLAALAVGTVLSVPAAADFPAHAFYIGTMQGKGVGKVPGLATQKVPISQADTFLELDATNAVYVFRVGADVIQGPMTTGKPGRFKIVQPSGTQLDDLLAGSESYLETTLGVGVNLSTVQVKGSHAMKRGGLSAGSKITLKVTGTTKLGGLPFTGTAKLKYRGTAAS